MDEFERQAARCVFVGIQGTTLAPAELELVRRGVGGVILFARNVAEPDQVAELARSLKAGAPGPLLICVDQEGGRVQRLRPPHWTAWPSMRRLGEIDQQGGLDGTNGTVIARWPGAVFTRSCSRRSEMPLFTYATRGASMMKCSDRSSGNSTWKSNDFRQTCKRRMRAIERWRAEPCALPAAAALHAIPADDG